MKLLMFAAKWWQLCRNVSMIKNVSYTNIHLRITNITIYWISYKTFYNTFRIIMILIPFDCSQVIANQNDWMVNLKVRQLFNNYLLWCYFRSCLLTYVIILFFILFQMKKDIHFIISPIMPFTRIIMMGRLTVKLCLVGICFYTSSL